MFEREGRGKPMIMKAIHNVLDTISAGGHVASIPHSDAAAEDALSGTPVE